MRRSTAVADLEALGLMQRMKCELVLSSSSTSALSSRVKMAPTVGLRLLPAPKALLDAPAEREEFVSRAEPSEKSAATTGAEEDLSAAMSSAEMLSTDFSRKPEW